MTKISARQIANVAIEAIKLNASRLSKDGVKVCHISTAYRRWTRVDGRVFGAPTFSTREDVRDVLNSIFVAHDFIAGRDISLMDAASDVDLLTDIVCARLGISVDSEMNDTARITAMVGFYIEACNRMHTSVDISATELCDAAAMVVASARSDATISRRIEAFLDDARYMRRTFRFCGYTHLVKEIHRRFLSITGLRASLTQADPVVDSTPVLDRAAAPAGASMVDTLGYVFVSTLAFIGVMFGLFAGLQS